MPSSAIGQHDSHAESGDGSIYRGCELFLEVLGNIYYVGIRYYSRRKCSNPDTNGRKVSVRVVSSLQVVYLHARTVHRERKGQVTLLERSPRFWSVYREGFNCIWLKFFLTPSLYLASLYNSVRELMRDEEEERFSVFRYSERGVAWWGCGRGAWSSNCEKVESFGAWAETEEKYE